MEVKIGIQSVPRELVFHTVSTYEEIEQALISALSDKSVFVLQDEKGGSVLVPVDKLAYVEMGGGDARRVGFGST